MNQCVCCGMTCKDFPTAALWLNRQICAVCARPMRGLSLWQPWAGFMASGEKTIETRFWQTTYRGQVLICAAKKTEADWRTVSSRPTADDRKSPLLTVEGFAVGVGTLADCRTMKKEDEAASMVRFDPWAGRFSWVFKDIRPLEPFAVRGAQGLFGVNASILRAAQ